MLSFLRAFLLVLAVTIAGVVPLSTPATVLASAALPRLFDTEAAAQAHCPRDVVVWLNIPTGVYREKGMRWYGRTKSRVCVCQKEADASGDRDTRNGR